MKAPRDGFPPEKRQEDERGGHPAITYIHPWETHSFPRIEMPLHKKIFAYHAMPYLERFKKIVREVPSTPIEELM